MIFRYAVRGFQRSAGLTAAILLAIALGVGSNAAVNAFAHGLTSRATVDEIAEPTGLVFLLRAAGIAVFAAACACVTALWLARASARSHEMTVRVALGAGRRHLLAQLLADAALLSIAGGALGVLFGAWSANIIPALFYDTDADQLSFALNMRDLSVVTAAGIALVILCGLVPLLDIRRHQPAGVLQRENAGSSRGTRQLRAGLVVVQMTLCCALVICAGLLHMRLRGALDSALGMRVGDLLLVTVQAEDRPSRGELVARGEEYFAETERTARAISGVVGTAWTARPPGSRPALTNVVVEPPDLPLEDLILDVDVVSPSSVGRFLLPPVAGRMFGGQDTSTSCSVALVNEAAASRVFGGDVVGRAVEDATGREIQIIGVVKTRPTQTAGDAERPTIYHYAAQVDAAFRPVSGAKYRRRGAAPGAHAVLDAHIVSASYFGTMKLNILAGSGFPTAAAGGACRTAVIDRTAAESLFGGNAIGGAIIDEAGRRTSIIGVVEAAHLRYWQRTPSPAIYLLRDENFVPRMTMLLRTNVPPEDLLAVATRHVSAVPGGKADIQVTTLATHLTRNALAPERISSTLVSVAAVLAFVLGVVGTYAVIAEAARQRRRDVAMRLALGARHRVVVRHILADGLRFAVAGAIGGLVVSLVLQQWMPQVPGDRQLTALWPWVNGPVMLIGLGIVASALPAVRAISTDPSSLLRER